jgi:hypothetical protein
MMGHPYSGQYKRDRLALIGLPCWQCGRRATTADHDPPLCTVRPGQRWFGVLRPMCKACMHEQAGRLSHTNRSFAHSRRW